MKTDNYYLRPHPSGGFLFSQGTGRINSRVFKSKRAGIKIIGEMLREKHISPEGAQLLILQLQNERRLPFSEIDLNLGTYILHKNSEALLEIEKMEVYILSLLGNKPRYQKDPRFVKFRDGIRIVGPTFQSPLLPAKIYVITFLREYYEKNMINLVSFESMYSRIDDLQLPGFPEEIQQCLN